MSALTEGGYVTLVKLGLTNAVNQGGPPGSGSTITMWASNTNNPAAGKGARYKGIVINIFSSAASAANGLTVEESYDAGTTWDAVQTGTGVLANTWAKVVVKVSGPEVRVRYVNSAAVLTTWRGSIMGDPNERGNG